MDTLTYQSAQVRPERKMSASRGRTGPQEQKLCLYGVCRMTRVQVWDGDGKTYLGEGELIGESKTYFWLVGDHIESLSPADERPPQWLIDEMENKGHKLIALPSNPKIQLDNGRIVFGCQVWWKRKN
jgi:hypothetical protein